LDRRTFLAASLAAVSLPARANLPTIGFVRSTPAAPFARLVTAFRAGLADAGLVEDRDVVVEYRWADNQPDRLPALVQELVRKEASVIVGNSQAVEAAKAATSSIPIVFVTSDDPVARGLVASMNRPGGNVTGITFYGAQLSAKRLEVLSEIVPRAKTVGVLVDPGWPGAQSELHDIENAARRLGLRLVVARAATAGELGDAFTIFTANKVDALMVAGSPFFTSNARDVVMLAARHRIAAAYDQREFVAAGGLMSYAGSFAGAYREAGVYAARIVRGAKPSELPVLQPTTFAFTINLPAAKALRLEIPASVRLRADEVID